ncbi:MAG: hypothetical protein P8Z70_13725, partial [Desulfuromonadales bacterium]
FEVLQQRYEVRYLPAESDTGMFGGNSNWRGPIWMPVNGLIIRALLQYFLYYGDSFTIECPTGSGHRMNLFEVAREIADRLARIFLRDESGRRPVFGGAEKFQTDPHWRDNILFYEYFHGDNGSWTRKFTWSGEKEHLTGRHDGSLREMMRARIPGRSLSGGGRRWGPGHGALGMVRPGTERGTRCWEWRGFFSTLLPEPPAFSGCSLYKEPGVAQ